MAEPTDIAQAVLDAATKAGADAADVLVSRGAAVSVDVREGALESAEREESLDLGLRVLVGQRQACIAASDIRPDALATMAERAVAMAKVAPEDRFAGLAEAGALAPDRDNSALEQNDPADDPDPATLQDDARRAEAAALAVAGVSQVQMASASFSRDLVILAATNGFLGQSTRSRRSVVVTAIAGEGLGMERDYAAESRTHSADLPPVEDIGNLAGTRATAMLGARKPPTGAFPVVFDERVASSLIGHLLGAVNGSAVVRGASWLRDALGKAVLPSGVSLIEEPRRLRSAASRLYDAEGLATADRAIVENGVLTGWTMDLATARQLDQASTGNAARGMSAPPTPSHSNVRLTQGGQSRNDLLAEMGTGLLVTSMIGSSVNPTTGDYSRGASGFWVEGGEIVYPVNECTIAGNLRAMLQTLTPANDAREHLSAVVPSLRVEGLTVAGG